MGTSPVTRTFGSGGSDPVAAFVFHSDNGFDNLIVANMTTDTWRCWRAAPMA